LTCYWGYQRSPWWWPSAAAAAFFLVARLPAAVFLLDWIGPNPPPLHLLLLYGLTVDLVLLYVAYGLGGGLARWLKGKAA